jgi:N-acetylneuraminic acid mutarotase
VLNGLLYVMGGLDNNSLPLRTVEVYNPANNTWRTVSGLPKPVFAAAAVAINGSIYVVGGYGVSGTYGGTQVYTP